MLTVPNFRAERCVRYRYAYSECSRCAEACPHGAVRLFDAGVELLAESCQGCALCVAVCPTDALLEKSVSSDTLLKSAGDSKRYTVSCAPSGARGDTVVPCLGAINAVTLAGFARRGIELHLAGSGHCGVCAHGATGQVMFLYNLEAREALGAVELAGGTETEWARLVMDEAAAGEVGNGIAASRRQLFRRMVGQGLDVVSGADEVPPPPLKAIRAAAPFLPERKELLNAIFDENAEPLRAMRHAAIPAENWVVEQGCTNCEACVRVCPTGAMQLLEDNEAWRLVLLAERCVACDVCVEVCQPKVLRQRDADSVVVNKQKGRLLRSIPRKRCTSCDRLFVTENDASICQICSSDDEDFAHIFG
ncbi:MAG: 4Fe-4S binding protein [Gammaproteobacteria bacterium]|nr:4Fe-4S binding protein [Gammaproteobacteria bacterium]